MKARERGWGEAKPWQRPRVYSSPCVGPSSAPAWPAAGRLAALGKQRVKQSNQPVQTKPMPRVKRRGGNVSRLTKPSKVLLPYRGWKGPSPPPAHSLGWLPQTSLPSGKVQPVSRGLWRSFRPVPAPGCRTQSLRPRAPTKKRAGKTPAVRRSVSRPRPNALAWPLGEPCWQQWRN